MNERLRIAFTIEQCWHRVPGGTGVAALGMARALAPRPSLDLCGVAARHRRPPPNPWIPPLRVSHLPLPRVPLYEAWHYLRWPPVQRATGPVDIIHATANAMPPKSAPLILTTHDLAYLHDPSHFTKRGLRFFSRGLDLARRDADLVLCPSRATIADCEGAGFERERLRLVPLGVEVEPVRAEEVPSVLGRYEISRPYLLWVGTIEPRKNLTGLLQAYAELGADIALVLVGPAGWNEDLSALTERYGVNVNALGFVPHEELRPLYAGASAFCFPSLSEGFGFPVLEAMAQGTPVITSAGTSTEELARDAGVLVDPRDPSSIAEGIGRVLNDEALADMLREAGKRRAAEYTWTRTGDLIEQAYRELAA